MISPAHFVALSVILFVIGGVGVLVRGTRSSSSCAWS